MFSVSFLGGEGLRAAITRLWVTACISWQPGKGQTSFNDESCRHLVSHNFEGCGSQAPFTIALHSVCMHALHTQRCTHYTHTDAHTQATHQWQMTYWNNFRAGLWLLRQPMLSWLLSGHVTGTLTSARGRVCGWVCPHSQRLVRICWMLDLAAKAVAAAAAFTAVVTSRGCRSMDY